MQRTCIAIILSLVISFSTGCSAAQYPIKQQVTYIHQTIQGPFQQGKASWYGPRFHGRKTSSGEKFNQNALTAAHPSLPFGSKIEVTDVTSGKKVTVRINDRGPFIRGRILDLSYAAANELGIVRKGVSVIQIRLL